MSLKAGIVGLPNAGKSTLFNALTQRSVPAENYPFCTIEPEVGLIEVRDQRLYRLAKLSESEKIIPAVVEFVDIAGLVRGAWEGEGLGNKFLSHIRETDMVIHVVRAFESGNVTHVEGEVDPLRDIEIIETELILSDLQTIERRLNALQKTRFNKESQIEISVAEKARGFLSRAQPLFAQQWIEEEEKLLRSWGLLSLKPTLFVVNSAYGSEIPQKLIEFFQKRGNSWVAIDARSECELHSFSQEEQMELRREWGTDGIRDLVRMAYEKLSLITFFTTGKSETRAWSIKKGTVLRDAGAAIHSDFRDKFIRGEVVFWEDLVRAGSYARAREQGMIRVEGKDYVVMDGDVVVFRI